MDERHKWAVVGIIAVIAMSIILWSVYVQHGGTAVKVRDGETLVSTIPHATQRKGVIYAGPPRQVNIDGQFVKVYQDALPTNRTRVWYVITPEKKEIVYYGDALLEVRIVNGTAMVYLVELKYDGSHPYLSGHKFLTYAHNASYAVVYTDDYVKGNNEDNESVINSVTR